MKVSVVIPMYNVAPYVEQCLESVMAQHYADIECIVVDDGSTDQSLELVEKKIAAYAGPVRFIICRHDRNRGQSAARNTGTAAATGDYVYYLDSDDEILPDCLALFADAVRERKPDFAVGLHAVEGELGPVWSPPRRLLGPREGPVAVLASFLRGDWNVMPWNKLVRRDFIMVHQLFFEEGLVLEDELWSLILACKAQSLVVVTRPTYVYRIHENSTMTSCAARRRFTSWVEILRRMDAFVNQEGLCGNAQLREYLTIRRIELVERATRAGEDAYQVYRREVRGASAFEMPVFRAMGLGWKMRYLHYLLPGRWGFLYLNAVMRGLRELARFKRRLGLQNLQG